MPSKMLRKVEPDFGFWSTNRVPGMPSLILTGLRWWRSLMQPKKPPGHQDAWSCRPLHTLVSLTCMHGGISRHIRKRKHTLPKQLCGHILEFALEFIEQIINSSIKLALRTGVLGDYLESASVTLCSNHDTFIPIVKEGAQPAVEETGTWKFQPYRNYSL